MEFKKLTPTQSATLRAADHVLNAPAEHIKAELAYLNGQGLLDIIDQILHDLDFAGVGIGWRIIELNLMRDRVAKGTQLEFQLTEKPRKRKKK